MGFFSSLIGGAVSGVGSIAGGLLSANSQSAANRFNYDAQKEFAQNGIQWRVADAKRAGIHPLFALGGSGVTYSPSAQTVGDYGLSSAGASMGQAIASRLSSFDRSMQNEQLINMKLQNSLLESQIAQIDTERALSTMGQSLGGAISRDLVKDASLGSKKKVSQFQSSMNSFDSLKSIGDKYGVSLELSPDGSLQVYPDPNSASGQSYSESNLAKVSWKFRSLGYTNDLLYELNKSAPKGKEWVSRFNVFTMQPEFYLRKKSSSLNGPVRFNAKFDF